MAEKVKLKPGKEPVGWPPIGFERLPWRPRVRASSRADRLLRDYDAAVPPRIAELVPRVGPSAVKALTDATAAIATLDAQAETDVGSLWTQLLRSESVASSKIERIYTKQSSPRPSRARGHRGRHATLRHTQEERRSSSKPCSTPTACS